MRTPFAIAGLIVNVPLLVQSVVGRTKLPSPGGVAPMFERLTASFATIVCPVRTPPPWPPDPFDFRSRMGGLVHALIIMSPPQPLSPVQSAAAVPFVGRKQMSDAWSSIVRESVPAAPTVTGRIDGFCVMTPFGPLA